MINFSGWKSCETSPPKKDGHYLVVRFIDGKLRYATDMDYTVAYGWNTNRTCSSTAIKFTGEHNKYAFWTTATFKDMGDMDMAEGVFIKAQTVPDCCGECFAFDENGCKFINFDKTKADIWKKRHPDCPMLTCRTSCSLLDTH